MYCFYFCIAIYILPFHLVGHVSIFQILYSMFVALIIVFCSHPYFETNFRDFLIHIYSFTSNALRLNPEPRKTYSNLLIYQGFLPLAFDQPTSVCRAAAFILSVRRIGTSAKSVIPKTIPPPSLPLWSLPVSWARE